MRNRGPAQCRQVHPVQRPDPDGGGAGGQLSLLHHRAQCRRCGGARPAAGDAGQDRRLAPRSFPPASPSSTSPAWCAAPPRAKAWATSSWPTSAKWMRWRMCCAVSRMTTSPMSRARSIPSRDAETVETELMLADLESLEKRIKPLEKKANSGEKEAKEAAGADDEGGDAAARRQARAPWPNWRRKNAAPYSQLGLMTAKPVLYVLQCRGRQRRHRQCHFRAASKPWPKPKAPAAW